ncbi:MAG TPA: polyprenyl diphosphate synthase [Thermotogota bacterium]|nr:polyprenyl diphosphate synthase [Thermotogota bacterium]HPJ87955.1 polyprenyl diphosphate synthase [Thermotogota bacterium]HPR95042.1 polyprenyl diphosphate synthase [Thermotogota bacterium]
MKESYKLEEIKKMHLPVHVAFIMDGNGRWAKINGLERSDGHAAGAEVAEKVVRLCNDVGIKYCTLYTFSTENWKRPNEEVEFLFQTLVYYLESKSPEMIERGVRIRFTGHIEALPKKAYETAKNIEEKSKHCDKLHMILALNYGGRQEIWDAFLRLYEEIKTGDSKEDVLNDENSEYLRNFLNLPDVPDPDLLVRTSGEKRLSNFLLWQLAYSEMIFTDIHWPDFDRKEFFRVLAEYSKRNRRFGAIEAES